jgi:hypothetical protein
VSPHRSIAASTRERLLSRDLADLRDEVEVRPDDHLAVQRRILGRYPIRRLRLHQCSKTSNPLTRAVPGPEACSNWIHGRGLARAVGPKAQDLPFSTVKVTPDGRPTPNDLDRFKTSITGASWVQVLFTSGVQLAIKE